MRIEVHEFEEADPIPASLDPDLSLKAKGLHWLFMNCPGQMKGEDIKKYFSDGTTSYRSALAELLDSGRVQVERCRDESGAYQTTYRVFVFPHVENPVVENQ